ncbi:hypothetical protein EC957_005070 [Mortierella hygrophila]|uniref:FAD-binding domain-containing protein n=1 Tax=Mortierella hygrophila TaxID=979708 RepID=A0A9P6JZV8_9FUNG|nr:hypothetical protein EC957_005070 [Mortierella hygrophila]
MEINPAVTFKHDRSVMYAKRPKVLIVGAGLAGLTMGMLLHKADIPFEIYERAPEVKPLGSAMYFSATTAPMFKQCGIYDEFVSVSKPVSGMKICNEERQLEYTIPFHGHKELFGTEGYIVARPKLYDILLRQIPQKHLHLGKKVLSMGQGGNGVLLRFSDGTEAEGDILVGADGAYSAVRQGLYEKLKNEKRLPAGDGLPLPFSTVSLVGQTRPLTTEEFPDIELPDCQFRTAVGANRPYAWKTFTTAQRTVCFIVTQFLDTESSKDNDAFRNSEWGPEAAQAMCEQVRDFPVISGSAQGVTMGDIIDWTPKDSISKVMLEEKVFDTWFDCRTVLIGDACHKFNPSGGVGAANAMHDAIVLANLINGLPFHPISEEVEDAFRAYKKERIDWVEKAYSSSAMFRTMAGPTMAAKMVRYAMKHIPAWAMRKVELRVLSNRPSVAYLPPQEDKGSVRPFFQPSLSAMAPVEEEKTRVGSGGEGGGEC